MGTCCMIMMRLGNLVREGCDGGGVVLWRWDAVCGGFG